MFDSINSLVKSYRMARDCFHENPNVELKLRLNGIRKSDGRSYNLPTVSEVAALIVGDLDDDTDKRDIIVQLVSGKLQRVSELHPSYLALQYPLLLPYGDDGYRIDICHKGVTEPNQTSPPVSNVDTRESLDNPTSSSKTIKKTRQLTTMREFFAYRLQDRSNEYSLILNGRRLLQQFIVDGYTMIERERLNFIKGKQNILRSETYEVLHKEKQQGNNDTSSIGQRYILPSSFTGGARYMMQNYLDAMAICKWYGYPDYFITITCNPKWPEVRRYLKGGTLNAEDRPDILCRIFKIKLDCIIKDLKDKELFGGVQAGNKSNTIINIALLFIFVNFYQLIT